MSLITLIEDDNTYQFSKYIDLVKTDNDKVLFEKFAYGVYDPKFIFQNEKQKKKLIVLTIIQLCQNNKQVSFSQIQNACNLNSPLEIELLLIEIIQKGLIIGTIDDQNNCLNIQRCISRDLKQSNIPQMKENIKNILKKTEELKQKLKK